MRWLDLFLLLLGVYAGLGCAFAAVFVVRGVQRVDPVAAHAGFGFRALIFPGSAALWPVLVLKWIRASRGARPS